MSQIDDHPWAITHKTTECSRSSLFTMQIISKNIDTVLLPKSLEKSCCFSLSVFRRQKYLTCKLAFVKKRFHNSILELWIFQMLLINRLWANYQSANRFPRTAVGKLRGLSITDAWRCTPLRKAWAISGNEKKVELELYLLNGVWEVKSFKRPTCAQNRAKLNLKTLPDHDLLNEFLESWC